MSSSVIITIVVVLGIIVAGGFLLYFCGDLLMGLAGKKKDAEVIKEKQLAEKKEIEDAVNALENPEEAMKDPAIAAILYDGAVVEAYDPNEDENAEELVEEFEESFAEEFEIESEEIEGVSDEVETEETEDTEEESEENDEEEDEAAEFIRQRRAELMERLARMQAEQAASEESEEEIEEDDEEVVDLAEETEEMTEDEGQEEPQETPVEETIEEEETEEIAEEDEEPSETTPVVQIIGGPLANMTMEELEAKLADEQERLKDNEKDLRQCKKEYIPLRRVKNTLENDEKKLRRKEALVAKQKVVLYGVNNYADIDEEKAKKLAEDLDLLDGLKLSVQHCQEVMDKNEERYPLLEKIFKLLSSQNEEIKADIKELEEAIAKLKEVSEDTDVPTDTDAE